MKEALKKRWKRVARRRAYNAANAPTMKWMNFWETRYSHSINDFRNKGANRVERLRNSWEHISKILSKVTRNYKIFCRFCLKIRNKASVISRPSRKEYTEYGNRRRNQVTIDCSLAEEHERHGRIVGDEFERRFQADLQAKKEDLDQCNVCLENFGENDVVTNLRCNHIFHKECVRMCFRSNVSPKIEL